MPHVADMNYVQHRFDQFVVSLETALKALGYPEAEIQSQCTMLRSRLAKRDYWLKADRPVCHLQSGKRVTRFLLRSAIQFSPAAKARVARLRRRYADECRAIRQESPHAVFFSFESAYSKHLVPDFAAHRKLLML